VLMSVLAGIFALPDLPCTILCDLVVSAFFYATSAAVSAEVRRRTKYPLTY
jgi:hypothetical protein